MNKKSLLSLVLTGVLTVGVIGSYAWFTSNATSSTNTVQTGELKVNLTANIDDGTQNPITLSTKKFQPGDVITVGANQQPGSFKIEVKNTGDFDMIFFDNFKVLKDDNGLQDVIYIKNAKNSLYNSSGTPMWEDQYFTNGVAKYPYYDGNKDGRVSLREWLNANNMPVSIGNGWHYSALKAGNGKFVTEYELAIDESADNTYINKEIQLAYQTYATQYNENAARQMITQIGASAGTGLDWTFVQGQYNGQ